MSGITVTVRAVVTMCALALLVCKSALAQAPAVPKEPKAKPAAASSILEATDKRTALVDKCPSQRTEDPTEQRRHALEHYNRGAVLYEQGDYGSAIDEFVAAFCDAPHPQMFFNIGQSFERTLDFETAVAYFERFLAESSPEATNVKRARVRVRVLRRLPARVKVATVPAAANIRLLRAGTLAARGKANADDVVLVEGGRYTMVIETPGYQPIEQDVELAIGQPYSYYFQLEKLRGTLRINVEPRSARIFIDDRLVGIGSYNETVDIGRYNVRVEADKRDSLSREVVVSNGRTTAEVVSLAAPRKTGRWELVAASTLMGLFAGISALAVVDDTAAGATIVIGGMGLGLGASLIAIPKDVRLSTSSYIITTSIAGGLQLGALSSIFLCDVGSGAECTDEGIVAAGAGGLLAGAAFGVLTASRFDLDVGDAAILNSGVIWGFGFGRLFHLAFDENPDLLAPLTLAGLNIGLITAATIAGRVTISRRRAAFIDLAGVGGVITGFALASVLDAEGERIAHVALGGATLGLIAGALLTRFVDEPDRDIAALSPVAGTIKDQAGKSLTTIGAAMRF